jgi:hypothetical protein
MKDSNIDHKKFLENAKHFFVREMDKHFVGSKFIISKDLQNLHEKYKSIAQNQLKNEMQPKSVNPILSQQLDQTIEIIFEQ